MLMHSWRRLGLAAAAFAMLSAGPALAKTTTFDFTGDDSLAQTFDFSSGGLDLSVSSVRKRKNGKVILGKSDVSRSSHGLGVLGFNETNAHLDGRGKRKDMLVFDFGDADVRLVEMEVDYADSADRYRLYDGSDGWQFLKKARIGSSENESWATHHFEGAYGSNTFGILAKKWKDDYTIRSLTVEWTDAPAPVPLPAGILLLASALSGIALIRRRVG